MTAAPQLSTAHSYDAASRIAFDPADEERFYVSPPANPGALIAHWACCGGRCDDTHDATCPVLAPYAPAIETALFGIRRELDQWGEWEHVHWFSGANEYMVARCSCGTFDICDKDGALQLVVIRFDELFELDGNHHWSRRHYTARPGTVVERRET